MRLEAPGGREAVAPQTASKESRLGRRVSERIVVFRVWGLGGGCLKYILLFSCVGLLTASQESRLGRRASECVVAFRVWGLGGGCLNFVLVWRFPFVL